MISYKLHLLQHLKDTDQSASENFCTQMQVLLEEDGFDARLVFSDEATFHVTGKVKKHNTRIWGTEHPHAIQEHVRDSLKVTCSAPYRRCVCMGLSFLKEQRSTVKRTLLCCKIG